MPIFALPNAAVALSGDDFTSALISPVALGIIAGLTLGKLLGIVGFSWLAIRSGPAELPAGLRMSHIVGAGFLAGIGFIMALFIAILAFPGSPYLNNAKIGVLLASLVSASLGLAILVTNPRTQLQEEPRPVRMAVNAYDNVGN